MNQQETKLAFLKREDIKTMAKDLAKLQEEEALSEKEKISKLRIEEKLKKETKGLEEISKTIIPKKETEPNNSLLPRTAKPSLLKKLMVRLFFVFLFLALIFSIGFGYWFLKIKSRPAPAPSPVPAILPTPSPSPAMSPTPSPISIIPPTPLIPVKETKILEIGAIDNAENSLRTLISQMLENVQIAGFFQIAVKKENKFLNFEELLAEFNLEAPGNLLGKIDPLPESATFFLYNKATEPRLGFIVKLKDKEIDAIIKEWEPDMEENLEPLFSLLGKQLPSLEKSFREAKYEETSFRYLSFVEKNLGICWALFNDYLIITSSGESLLKTVDLLK